MCVLDRTVAHTTVVQHWLPESIPPCNCIFFMNHLNHILSTGTLRLQAATWGFCVPKLRVLDLAYSYMLATLKICMSCFIHAHLAHTVSFASKMSLPTSDWKEGFHWVAPTVDTEFLPIRHNYGKGICEKSLFGLMLGQHPQTAYWCLHFFAIHLSAISCHLKPYNKPRNNVTWAFERCTCISSLNHAHVIASIPYGSCAPTSVCLNETYDFSLLRGWTATTHYCWTATS
jgi:hypothetical protein